MKKLEKLKLKDYHEMSNYEMKGIVGGQYDPSYKPACGSSQDSTCGGVCPPKYSDGILVSQKCNKPSSSYIGGYGSGIKCYCA